MVTLLYTNYPSISAIDLTLQSYLTSTQIGDSYYTKSEIDTTLNLYSPSAQILSNSYSKLYIDNLFLTSAQTGALYYNKTDTGNLLANKVSTTGDVSISGNLGVGVGAASSMVKAHVNHEGSTGHVRMEAKYRNQSILSFGTTFGNGCIFFEVKNDYHMYCGNNLAQFYKTTSNVSDDSLKEK